MKNLEPRTAPLFAHHICSINVSPILQTIRKSNEVLPRDICIVQSILELMDDITMYAGFEITCKTSNYKKTVQVFKDQVSVAEFEMKGIEISLLFIKSGTDDWVEELYAIANAHAELQQIK